MTAELVTYEEYAGTNEMYQIRLLTKAMKPNNKPQQEIFLKKEEILLMYFQTDLRDIPDIFAKRVKPAIYGFCFGRPPEF